MARSDYYGQSACYEFSTDPRKRAQRMSNQAPLPIPQGTANAQGIQQAQQVAGLPQWSQVMQSVQQNPQLASIIFQQYVTRFMIMRGVPPQLVNNLTVRGNFVRAYFPQLMPYMGGIPQTPIIPQPPKKTGVKINENDEIDEVIEELPSSDEAEFTSESDGYDDFMDSDLPDDFVPSDPSKRRTAGRERKSVQNFESEGELSDEEEDIFQGPATAEESKIDHIFLSRQGPEEIEFLVRFQDTKDGLCQWVPGSLLMCLDNADYHMSRFKQKPCDIEEIPEKDIVPIAHRKFQTTAELLFRMSFDQTGLLFWDTATPEQMERYERLRRRIDIIDPVLPEGDLPEPTVDIINKESESTLREYQLTGLKWLIKCWREGHGSILADEMGLGKTIQVLSFLTYLNRYTDWHGPFLITVRTNTFKQWCEEIEKWTDLTYIPYNSTPQQRKMIREYQFPYLDELGNPVPNTYSFNILLISYDVFLKDAEFLSEINWEVLIVDEGHRIKNHEGKKNNMMKQLNAKQRIILTGTPVQNTLLELWTLLNFVSPDCFEEDPEFLQDQQDIESLDEEQMENLRTLIHKHILRRTVAEAEHTIAPKAEFVSFVSLSPVQRELIRLIKLHKMWRLKGIQIDESTVDTSHESASIQKVCCHPFLIEGAEEYYRAKFPNMSRLQFIRDLSNKFIWLEKMLEHLKAGGHRVLIFSQKVQLLKILQEFLNLKKYENEILVGEMAETEKHDAIRRFSDKKSTAFVFLISTRAGNEGLNLTVADTAIIFDPDWNPQNDLQAQARVHRIGQTQKVDIIRLIAYQTYEHQMFVRAQRKLGLWGSLLGLEEEAPDTVHDMTKLKEPPIISSDMVINPNENILEQISTMVVDFSTGALPRLEEPLEHEDDYNDNGEDDEDFIQRFPVVNDDQFTRRVKRSRSYDNIIKPSTALEIFEEFKNLGYGEWDALSNKFNAHSVSQIERFCLSILILCFRAIQPMSITTFPFLLKLLQRDVADFRLDLLLCNRKGKWLQGLPEDHELTFEMDSCKTLKDTIFDTAFEYLSVIEMKLIAKCWLTFGSKSNFPFTKLPPPQTRADKEHFENLLKPNEAQFDPYDERVQCIVNEMRAQIIAEGQIHFAAQLEFWTGPEFASVMYVLKNFAYSLDDPLSLHMKTAILSKTTEQITDMVVYLEDIFKNKQSHYPVNLSPAVTHFDKAPEDIQMCKGATAWATLLKRDIGDINDRILALKRLQERTDRLGVYNETAVWGPYHTKRLYECLLEYGLEYYKAILLDKKIGLNRVINKMDKKVIQGKRKSRSIVQGSIPDFVLSEEDLLHHIIADDTDLTDEGYATGGPNAKPADLGENDEEEDAAKNQDQTSGLSEDTTDEADYDPEPEPERKRGRSRRLLKEESSDSELDLDLLESD